MKKITISRWKIALIFIGIIILSAVGLSIYGYQLQSNVIDQASAVTYNQRTIEAQHIRDTFGQLPIHAKSVYIQNISTREAIYEKDSDILLPLASLTKIMTAFVALQHLDPDSNITFSHKAISQTGDQGFTEGEQWTLSELIPFMIATSSNDAAYAIAEAVEEKTGTACVTLMNETAHEIGLASLDFRSPTGLDTYDATGNKTTTATGSAQNMASLLYYVAQKYPDIFGESRLHDIHLGAHVEENTNILAASVPGLLASKTGYTDTANGNLAFIIEIGPNQPYAVVLLGSTYNGRFDDAKKIISTLYDVVAQGEAGV